jgi:hypothetical protein
MLVEHRLAGRPQNKPTLTVPSRASNRLAGVKPFPDSSKAAIRRAAARTNRAGVQLDLLASCGGKWWVVEYAGPVLEELDAAVEGSAIDHVERDVGVAVVDAF